MGLPPLCESSKAIEHRQTANRFKESFTEVLNRTRFDGGGLKRVGTAVEASMEALRRAKVDALEELAPRLSGTFWISNIYTSRYQHERCDPTVCDCGRKALRRTLRHVGTGDRRKIDICPTVVSLAIEPPKAVLRKSRSLPLRSWLQDNNGN